MTGDLTTICNTKCSADFDYERVQAFYLTVTATDGGDRSNSTALELHLQDVNDNAPTFNREFAAFVSENDNTHSPVNGTALLTVEVHFVYLTFVSMKLHVVDI